MNILDKIAAYKAEEVALAKQQTPLADLEVLVKDCGPVRPFHKALERQAANRPPMALIAEIKKASPSKGLIREDFYPVDHAKAYEAAGAACLSILTDTPSFQGQSSFLIESRSASTLPCLRKDFMIDPYQCYEARAWGADCILLIMAMLSDLQAEEIEKTAHALNMDVLIEVHDADELSRALRLQSPMIGINNRNLKTFDTTLTTTADLAALCPPDRFLISESGIRNYDDLVKLEGYGAKAFLVGESLMREPDVTLATRRLIMPQSHAQAKLC